MQVKILENELERARLMRNDPGLAPELYPEFSCFKEETLWEEEVGDEVQVEGREEEESKVIEQSFICVYIAFNS